MTQTTTDLLARIDRVLDNPATERECEVCGNFYEPDDPDDDGRCLDCVGAGRFPWNCKARWA